MSSENKISDEIISKYKELNSLSDKIKESITSFYIFKNRSKTSPYNINGENCIYVTNNNEVYAFGKNSLGCLGITSMGKINSKKPEKIWPKNGVNITTPFHIFNNGSYHVIALNNDGKIFSWGFNNLGQLGNGDCEFKSYEPKEIEDLSNIIMNDVSCGDWHSLALTEEGDIYAWGDNQFGQIGNESVEKCVKKPEKLVFENEGKIEIEAISCGSLHSMALTKKGSVFSWGFNKYGQLGVGDNIDKKKPIKVSLNNEKIIRISCGQKCTFLLSEDGSVYIFGRCYLNGGEKYQMKPLKIPKLPKISDISSNIANCFTIALSEGYIYEFGKTPIIQDENRFGFAKKYKKLKEGNKIEIEPEMKNFLDYYSKYQITHKTIHLENNIEITSTNNVKRNQSNKTSDNEQTTNRENTGEVDEESQNQITVNNENFREVDEELNPHVRVVSPDYFQERRAMNVITNQEVIVDEKIGVPQTEVKHATNSCDQIIDDNNDMNNDGVENIKSSIDELKNVKVEHTSSQSDNQSEFHIDNNGSDDEQVLNRNGLKETQTKETLTANTSDNKQIYKGSSLEMKLNGEEVEDALLAALMQVYMTKHRRENDRNAKDDYGSEIVDQLRQCINTLIGEMKESSKEFNEKTVNANKEIVQGIKELQSGLTKALLEELPKILANHK